MCIRDSCMIMVALWFVTGRALACSVYPWQVAVENLQAISQKSAYFFVITNLSFHLYFTPPKNLATSPHDKSQNHLVLSDFWPNTRQHQLYEIYFRNHLPLYGGQFQCWQNSLPSHYFQNECFLRLHRFAVPFGKEFHHCFFQYKIHRIHLRQTDRLSLIHI